ncbi:MAG: hypothetical protein E7668_03190 [Ruminococcaceae bacterium]|nr:hypothetical protein [Oscillospiraceae bacterium]
MRNLFEIDYLQKMSVLLQEAFQFKKYKAMPVGFAILLGILMIPWVLSSFLFVALFSVATFLFSVVLLPVKALHSVVHNESQNALHATQFILYFISWPLIFLLYVVLALLVPILFVLYAALSLTTYIWSFCGFRFHLFPTKEDISVEVNGTYIILPLIYGCIGWILFIFVPIIHGLIIFAELYEHYREADFPYYFFNYVLPPYVSLRNTFSMLFSLIGFSKSPKPKDYVVYMEEIPAIEATQDCFEEK